MTDKGELYNTVAPLANVTRLVALIDRAQNRGPGLPGLGCFYGRAGLGKTTAGIYATNTLNACHIEALPFGGPRDLGGRLNACKTGLFRHSRAAHAIKRASGCASEHANGAAGRRWRLRVAFKGLI
ncbi:MAG: hypothetical protein ACLGIE_09440 [Alphaproteobacteria bacterium]